MPAAAPEMRHRRYRHTHATLRRLSFACARCLAAAGDACRNSFARALMVYEASHATASPPLLAAARPRHYKLGAGDLIKISERLTASHD